MQSRPGTLSRHFRSHGLRLLTQAALLLGPGVPAALKAQEIPEEDAILWSVDWSPQGEWIAVGGSWTGVFDTARFARRCFPALDRTGASHRVVARGEGPEACG